MAPRAAAGVRDHPRLVAALTAVVLAAVLVGLNLLAHAPSFSVRQYHQGLACTNEASGSWPPMRSLNHYDPTRTTAWPAGASPCLVPTSGLRSGV